MFNVEEKIIEWKDSLRIKGNFKEENIIELESHLRDEIDELVSKDLTEEESFIIALKRLGSSDLLNNEYGKINTNAIWKNLVFYETDKDAGKKLFKDIILLIILALSAGLLARIPELFGMKALFSSEKSDLYFYVKLIGLFIAPSIAVYFLIKNFNFINLIQKIFISASFIITASAMIFMPVKEPFHTAVLTGIHLPLFLWCIIGITYTGRKWNLVNNRMNFIRFSGETFIYAVLLLCGNFVLWVFTSLIFEQIGIDIGDFYLKNILIFTIFAIPVISIYLVEAKKSIVENLAPILAKIFSPLFLVTMIIFLIIILIFKKNPSADRNFLITFNFMLILVVGLVTYVISARKDKDKIKFFDYINLLIILTAVIIDIIALGAIITRITKYGFSANKTAALGENIILLSNLAGLAVFYIRFFIKKNKFILLEKWQTFYLYIIFFWCMVVSFIFPVIFKFK